MKMEENLCLIKFIEIEKGYDYHEAPARINIGRYAPTRKKLKEVADTLAADMIGFIKNGGQINEMTPDTVYANSS